MSDELKDQHQEYRKRAEFYKQYGYDIEQERKFILQQAQPLCGRILEVGTGKGHFTLELARQGHRFISVDISSQTQQLAKSVLKESGLERLVDFKVADIECSGFADASFDVIFSVNTVHHFTRPFKVFDELMRITASRGKIILSDFTQEGFALVKSVHAAEGREHSSGEMDIQDAYRYFAGKKYQVYQCRSKFQEVLVACRQAA